MLGRLITTAALSFSRRRVPVARMSGIARTADEVRFAAESTIADYAAVADGYAAGNMNHAVSQNIEAMLEPLASVGVEAPYDILDGAGSLPPCPLLAAKLTRCGAPAHWQSARPPDATS